MPAVREVRKNPGAAITEGVVGTGFSAVVVAVPSPIPLANVYAARSRASVGRALSSSLPWSLPMIRAFFVVAFLSTFALAGSASANQAATSARPQMNGQRNGPIAKLIELERRKNEWLRQQFGR
jgi:hypothetical protein